MTATKERAYSLQVRGMDRRLGARLQTAAAARHITVAEYITRLVALHERMRVLAVPDLDGGKLMVDALVELTALGLEAVNA